jgi:2-oxoglutarate ferredoxin oxidoreductase subunit alpha
VGRLELQTIWPVPKDLVREKTANAKNVFVVEMNMGQVMAQVKQAVDNPDHVYLVNRVDGTLVTPTDIGNVMRVIEGKGV